MIKIELTEDELRFLIIACMGWIQEFDMAVKTRAVYGIEPPQDMIEKKAGIAKICEKIMKISTKHNLSKRS